MSLRVPYVLTVALLAGCATTSGSEANSVSTQGPLQPGIYGFRATIDGPASRSPYQFRSRSYSVHVNGLLEVYASGGGRVIETSHPGVRVARAGQGRRVRLSAPVTIYESIKTGERCIAHDPSSGECYRAEPIYVEVDRQVRRSATAFLYPVSVPAP
jgi:hypothetical protein